MSIIIAVFSFIQIIDISPIIFPIKSNNMLLSLSLDKHFLMHITSIVSVVIIDRLSEKDALIKPSIIMNAFGTL